MTLSLEIASFLSSPSLSKLHRILGRASEHLFPSLGGPMELRDRPYPIMFGPLAGRKIWVGTLPWKGSDLGDIWLDAVSLAPFVLLPQIAETKTFALDLEAPPRGWFSLSPLRSPYLDAVRSLADCKKEVYYFKSSGEYASRWQEVDWHVKPSEADPDSAKLSFDHGTAVLTWLDLWNMDSWDYAVFALFNHGALASYFPQDDEWCSNIDIDTNKVGIANCQSVVTGTEPARWTLPAETTPRLSVRASFFDNWADEMRGGTWEPFPFSKIKLTGTRPRTHIFEMLQR